MFAVIVDITVKREFVEQFREVVIRQGHNSRSREDGCLGFDILQDPEDPTRFTLFETYVDSHTFHEVHRKTPHFAEYAAATAPWVEGKTVRALTRIWPGLDS
jgi:quinol monooxygenase YgiN